MISLKRMSLLFSVLNGKFIFHEENISERLAGILVMIIGVVFIAVR